MSRAVQIVIADTSPLNYLIQIGQIDVLPRLYMRILIPPAVIAELNNPIAPEVVRVWISRPAEWLVVQTPRQTTDRALIEAKLGPGEREAILLGQEFERG